MLPHPVLPALLTRLPRPSTLLPRITLRSPKTGRREGPRRPLRRCTPLRRHLLTVGSSPIAASSASRARPAPPRFQSIRPPDNQQRTGDVGGPDDAVVAIEGPGALAILSPPEVHAAILQRSHDKGQRDQLPRERSRDGRGIRRDGAARTPHARSRPARRPARPHAQGPPPLRLQARRREGGADVPWRR